jgi:hypothetical protein
MITEYPISVEEEAAIDALGGFDHVVAITDSILRNHNIQRSLFSEREKRRIRQGRHFTRKAIKFQFDPGKSLRANIEDLLNQAESLQAEGGGTNYVGAMLQHLVGAKLELVLGKGKVAHHGFSVADRSTSRNADYQIDTVAIHVTTHPSEALVRKCADNLKTGLKPLIITLADAVRPAHFLLNGANIADRVDVLDIAQFLTANVYERSFFKTFECKVTLATLLDGYNAIVAKCETDPSLLVRITH